jgi:ADP-ribosylglycohydrolase
METMKKVEIVREALRNLFVGDAIAMPVHWFYNTGDIFRAFPPNGVTKLEAPPAKHPTAIMTLHSTSGGGRKSAQFGAEGGGPTREIVGDVILCGKRHLWNVREQHYHVGMRAGDNTLNAHCARAALRSIAATKQYDRNDFLDRYVALLTAADPPQHPDTYAESYHRGFFANLERGDRPRHECGALTHDTPSVGALVTVAAIALPGLMRASTLDASTAVRDACVEHVALTHPGADVARYVRAYVDLLARLLANAAAAGGGIDAARHEISAIAEASAGGINLAAMVAAADRDEDIVGGTYSTACYLDSSWPSLLFLSHKYADDPTRALLANANLGGDNVHRGAIIGIITGLASGKSAGTFFRQLCDSDAIDAEIKAALE